MSTIIIYTMEYCPNCEKLKEALNGLGIDYEEQNIETKEAIIDLRRLCCFPQESPVLIFMNTCYESPMIFGKDGEVNRHLIHRVSGKVI